MPDMILGKNLEGYNDCPSRRFPPSGLLFLSPRRFSRIHIKGERVVELDYSAMIVHLLYAKAGLHVPVGDLYAIEGLSPESRPGIKRFTAAMAFDTKPREKFPRDVYKQFAPSDQAKGCEYVRQAILRQHERIAHLFGKGLGHGLQFVESQIMAKLLLTLREWGLVGLPVHDCLIVPRSHAHDIQNIMEDVSEAITKVVIPVTRKDGSE